MAETMKLRCPVCQTPAEKPLNIAINTRLQPALKEKLLDGSLLMFECTHCGAKRRITTQFLYHDPDKKLLFYVAPTFNEQREAILQQLHELLLKFPVSVEDYEMRIMLDAADLMEKVQLFDYGFHDREIELVKMLSDGLFAQEHPDKVIKSRYYFTSTAGQPKFLYMTEDEQLMVDCNEKLLTFIRSKFKKALEPSTKGKFIVINHAWANHVLKNKNDTDHIQPS